MLEPAEINKKITVNSTYACHQHALLVQRTYFPDGWKVWLGSRKSDERAICLTFGSHIVEVQGTQNIERDFPTNQITSAWLILECDETCRAAKCICRHFWGGKSNMLGFVRRSQQLWLLWWWRVVDKLVLRLCQSSGLLQVGRARGQRRENCGAGLDPRAWRIFRENVVHNSQWRNCVRQAFVNKIFMTAAQEAIG